MANKVTVSLKAGQLGYLGKISGLALTNLSPLNGLISELSPAEINELKKNGILDASGVVADGFRPALVSLANAHAFARTRLTKGLGMLEYVVYFAPDGSPCSLLAENGGFWLEYPADSKTFTPLLEELIGTSSLRNTEFKAEFDSHQGLVLSAAIDITRRALLKTLIDGSDKINADFSPEEIDQWLDQPSTDAQWLSSIAKGVMPASALELSGIINSLDKLVQSDFVMKNGTKYALNEQTASLASRFLIIDKLMSMRAGTSSSGQVDQIGFICLSAGVNDLLMLEADENSLYIETVSARQVMDFTSQLLSEPIKPTQNIKAVAADNAKPADVALTCPNCGGSILATSKFCGSCGSSIQSAPAFCGKCGAEIKEGTRFCGGCGSPI